MNVLTVILAALIAIVSLPGIGLGASLVEIVQVGSGLQAKVEVRGDDAMTYLLRKKDVNTWLLDIARYSPGAVPASIPLSLPAATGISVEQRKIGKIEATRLTVSVRPNVDVTATPSDDRRTLTISFSSAPQSADADKLLADLDDGLSGKDSLEKPGDLAPSTGEASSAGAVAAASVPALSIDDPGVPGRPVGKGDDSVPPRDDTLPSDLDRELKRLEEKAEDQPFPKSEPLPDAPQKAAVVPPSPVVTAPKQEVETGALTPDELAVTPPVAVEKSPDVTRSPIPPSHVEAAGLSKPSVTLSGSSFEMVAPGIVSVRAFTLFQPTRVVMDLFGVSADLSASLPTTGFPPSVRGIRSSRYPDKVRIVFDMKGDELPEYAVARNGSAVRITFR